ncbi:MAG: hypothetical protein CMK33_00160 [Porticoccaceae bacterium]|nr:hypothetical protein [Porticoccaceae bacterium]
MNTGCPVEAARALQPLIDEKRREGELRARLVPEVVAAAGSAGMFRLFAPREVGGLEVTPRQAFLTTAEIAAADPAVSWYMVNSIPACMAAALLPETERRELFAEPDRNFGFSAVALATAKPAPGGYRLSGSWPVVTGCEDSRWCALMARVVDEDGPRLVNGRPEVRLFLVPTERLEIAQTWQHAAAMRGTGSNQVTVADLYVPEALATVPGAAPRIDRPLFRNPATVLTLPIFAAVAVGVLQGAIAAASREIATKISSITGRALKDQSEIQVAIADATAALRAIRAGCAEAYEAVWQQVSRGEPLSGVAKAELYASSFYAGDVARDMVGRLYVKGSRAAFMQGHPLERCLSNVHAIIAAIEARRGFQQSAGGVLLGAEPVEPGF